MSKYKCPVCKLECGYSCYDEYYIENRESRESIIFCENCGVALSERIVRVTEEEEE